jgi:hypothetical protein
MNRSGLPKFLLAFSALLVLAPIKAKADCNSADIAIAASLPQGGLLRGRVPLGSRLLLRDKDPSQLAREILVGAKGQVLLGAGRDETGPLQLQVILTDDSICPRQVEVIRRDWPLERVDGVPEETVNPPPAIAARIEHEQGEVATARERDDPREDFDTDFAWPLTGRISGVFGSQRIYNGTPKSPHSGLDVAAAQGVPVLAPAAGVISFARPDLYLTGGTILIDHGHGLSSSFLHLSKLEVKLGQRVEKGQVIGLVGATGRATGPHMHWGLNWFGVRLDPQLLVDPLKNPGASPSAEAPSR